MTSYKTILAAFSLTLTMAAASTAQPAPAAPSSSLSEACADCPANVVFSSSYVPQEFEPESYAMRGDNNDAREITTPSLSAEGRLAAQPDGKVVSSKQ